jgi:uncharacterized protein (TIGR00255 family)
MTAFGRGEALGEGYRFTVELRTVNHRFCDIRVKLPRGYSEFEEDVKRVLNARFSRGRIEVNVAVDETLDKLRQLTVDFELAKTYQSLLLNLKEELGLVGDLHLENFLAFRDIFVFQEDPESHKQAWLVLQMALDQAVRRCLQMRVEEGMVIQDDFGGRLRLLETAAREIETRAPLVVEEVRDRLHKRITELIGEADVDEARLAQEVAFFAEKSDVTEELIRFQSHIQQFLDLLGANGARGRQLEFLLQEMHREINTIGSKANDLTIVQKVIEVKTELEKLREQVQNVE